MNTPLGIRSANQEVYYDTKKLRKMQGIDFSLGKIAQQIAGYILKIAHFACANALDFKLWVSNVSWKVLVTGRKFHKNSQPFWKF